MFPRFIKQIMVAIAPIALLSAAFVPVSAQAPGKSALTVKVTSIRNADGNIRIIVRSSPDTIVTAQVAEIDAKTMTAQAIFNLPPGTYNVAAIHDENKNGTLDFDSNGMPIEGYGHSNNPEKRMGAPSFDETKFALTESAVSIEINLIYWP